MEKKFNKGDYIVLIGAKAQYEYLPNHCYKTRIDSKYMRTELDSEGNDENGWDTIAANNNKNWRYATPAEIYHYDSIGKPYDVSILNSSSSSSEASGLILKPNKEEIIRDAKTLYNKGDKFIDLVNNVEFEISELSFHTFGKDNQLYVSVKKKEDYSNKTARIYDNGTWAKIVSTKESSTKQKYYNRKGEELTKFEAGKWYKFPNWYNHIALVEKASVEEYGKTHYSELTLAECYEVNLNKTTYCTLANEYLEIGAFEVSNPMISTPKKEVKSTTFIPDRWYYNGNSNTLLFITENTGRASGFWLNNGCNWHSDWYYNTKSIESNELTLALDSTIIYFFKEYLKTQNIEEGDEVVSPYDDGIYPALKIDDIRVSGDGCVQINCMLFNANRQKIIKLHKKMSKKNVEVPKATTSVSMSDIEAITGFKPSNSNGTNSKSQSPSVDHSDITSMIAEATQGRTASTSKKAPKKSAPIVECKPTVREEQPRVNSVWEEPTIQAKQSAIHVDPREIAEEAQFEREIQNVVTKQQTEKQVDLDAIIENIPIQTKEVIKSTYDTPIGFPDFKAKYGNMKERFEKVEVEKEEPFRVAEFKIPVISIVVYK